MGFEVMVRHSKFSIGSLPSASLERFSSRNSTSVRRNDVMENFDARPVRDFARSPFESLNCPPVCEVPDIES